MKKCPICFEPIKWIRLDVEHRCAFHPTRRKRMFEADRFALCLSLKYEGGKRKNNKSKIVMTGTEAYMFGIGMAEMLMFDRDFIKLHTRKSRRWKS